MKDSVLLLDIYMISFWKPVMLKNGAAFTNPLSLSSSQPFQIKPLKSHFTTDALLNLMII